MNGFNLNLFHEPIGGKKFTEFFKNNPLKSIIVKGDTYYITIEGVDKVLEAKVGDILVKINNTIRVAKPKES